MPTATAAIWSIFTFWKAFAEIRGSRPGQKIAPAVQEDHNTSLPVFMTS